MVPIEHDAVAFLNRLLESERAGVKVLSALLQEMPMNSVQSLAKNFLHDEGMNCQVIRTIIDNLNGTASPHTGDFVQKVAALATLEEKLALLIKGQEWVATYIRRNRGLIPKSSDRMFIEAMKIQHEENVDTLSQLIHG